MKKIISAVALSAAFLGVGLAMSTQAQAAKVTAVPKSWRSSWGCKPEDYYLVKFTKNSYAFSNARQSKKGNWILNKKNNEYVNLKLSKKLRVNKTFTLGTANKHGYRKLQYKVKSAETKKAFTTTFYYKLSGKKLRVNWFNRGDGFSIYNKLPTLASRNAYFNNLKAK
ncbi:hypothetical protein [Levilactobacillus yiduensis]|uniref:hypothetical protein n=1 Tax=Levilactobacillus yiduensis TaxID=2953880 RepID=UPI000EF2E7D7|nr:hypothetical protein [Levilactobacillus yiduensis]AYM01915.1 hypothetical protein D8911_02490 [Levilactobacillus brevis]